MEWLRLLPNRGRFPQTLQTLAMSAQRSVRGREGPAVRTTALQRGSVPAEGAGPQPPPFAGLPEAAGSPRPARPGPGWWFRPLTDLAGVGRASAERAGALGLRTIGDLLEHLPGRYEAYDAARPIAMLA